jgi:hypothetical protein
MRDELGIDLASLARPLQAAWISAASFACFAAVPIAALLFAPEALRIPMIAASSLVSLAVLGAFGGHLGRRADRPGRIASHARRRPGHDRDRRNWPNPRLFSGWINEAAGNPPSRNGVRVNMVQSPAAGVPGAGCLPYTRVAQKPPRAPFIVLHSRAMPQLIPQ